MSEQLAIDLLSLGRKHGFDILFPKDKIDSDDMAGNIPILIDLEENTMIFSPSKEQFEKYRK